MPLAKVTDALRGIRTLSLEYGIRVVNFGHIGDGNVHTAPVLDPESPDEVEQAKLLVDAIHRLAIRLSGSTKMCIRDRVAIGTVLPHPIAGYSGGGKAIAVGVASSDTIASTHTVDMLDHPNTGLGLIEGNPFYEVAIEMARLASLDFIVNCVVNEQEEIVDIIAGDVEEMCIRDRD